MMTLLSCDSLDCVDVRLKTEYILGLNRASIVKMSFLLTGCCEMYTLKCQMYAFRLNIYINFHFSENFVNRMDSQNERFPIPSVSQYISTILNIGFKVGITYSFLVMPGMEVRISFTLLDHVHCTLYL